MTLNGSIVIFFAVSYQGSPYFIHNSFLTLNLLPLGGCSMAQMIKNPLVMQETWVQSLGQEHPLEKGMATHSSILA